SGHGNRLLLSGGAVIDSGTFGALMTVTNGGPKGDNNIISLQDAGTVWSNAGPVTVGVGGSGNLLAISNGAVFLTQSISGGTLSVGGLAIGSSNELAVAGSGSYLDSASDINIGISGSFNRMTMSRGAAVSSRSTLAGINSSA